MKVFQPVHITSCFNLSYLPTYLEASLWFTNANMESPKRTATSTKAAVAAKKPAAPHPTIQEMTYEALLYVKQCNRLFTQIVHRQRSSSFMRPEDKCARKLKRKPSIKRLIRKAHRLQLKRAGASDFDKQAEAKRKPAAVRNPGMKRSTTKQEIAIMVAKNICYVYQPAQATTSDDKSAKEKGNSHAC